MTFLRVHFNKMFVLSLTLALLLSPLAFFPQATEDSRALDLNIEIATGETFRFDDTYPPLTAEVRYDISQSSSVVGTIFMPFNDDGITWTNETFITRSGTGVSAVGGDLTGAGFDLGFGSPYGETGTMTLIYEDASDAVLQTTTINFEIVQPEITSVLVNGGAMTEGQEFIIPQGGELTVTVEGTSNFTTGNGVSVENQVNFELSTIDILIQSGTYESVTELGPFFFAYDPDNSQTFGPFTVLLTNTANVTPGTYPIFINKFDADGVVPTSTFFNLTVTPPASFCGDQNVDEPNDDSQYEFCDNGGLCDDNTTVCDAHADCDGIGSELCTPRAGDSCDENCLSEYFLNLSLSAQYCAPGETITGSYSVSLPLVTDELALTISDENNFAPLSDEIYFTDVTINGGSPFVNGTLAPFSFPTNSGTILSSGVSTVEFEIFCDTLSSPWHVYLSGIDTDLAQNVGGSIRSLPISITNTPPVCGDSSVDIGETCDDGGESVTCDADCTAVSCGDGTSNASAGETCDDGANNGNPGSCNATCDGFEPAAATGGGAASRGRLGDRNTFGDDEAISEDGVPELVITGDEIGQDEGFHGSAEESEETFPLDFSQIDLGYDSPRDYIPMASAYAWIEGYVSIPDSSDSDSSEYVTPSFQGFQVAPTYTPEDGEIDETLEPEALPFGFGYPDFRDELRLDAESETLLTEQPFEYQTFDATVTQMESLELSASLPFEIVKGLYSEFKYLLTSLEMIEIMPESGEGWEVAVISEEKQRIKDLSLSLETTYADQYDFGEMMSLLPNAFDCPTCAPYFSMAVTMYRQYLLPLEIMYADLLCDAELSLAEKRSAERILLDTIDQMQGVVEHYLAAYGECRVSVSDEFCPENIDLEAFAPDMRDDQCVEEPVFVSDDYTLDALEDLDDQLGDALKAFRRANNRIDYSITAPLTF